MSVTNVDKVTGKGKDMVGEDGGLIAADIFALPSIAADALSQEGLEYATIDVVSAPCAVFSQSSASGSRVGEWHTKNKTLGVGSGDKLGIKALELHDVSPGDVRAG
ncbi:hypothetical protein D9615_004585 [Tricholomella constricta]|uniref:Uncharacterized protein n=1 Tax=Tricholomella constricta TaxID=117010 RepID=A0A8H5M4I6_9AGAR|nr:hypothetical protein D9615_004585 [Tricholomella constricta]